jgi:uncharacterized protein YkwD
MIGDLEVRKLRYWVASGLLALAAAGVPSASAADGSLAEQMLAAHNAARAKVKTKPLVWSEQLARSAQEWANVLIARRGLMHDKHSRYGENIYEVSVAKATPEGVVKRWVDEAEEYDYKTNRCRGACGHYTQVIWRNTKEVGCAVARMGDREVWVCRYSPPGNYVGERPY